MKIAICPSLRYVAFAFSFFLPALTHNVCCQTPTSTVAPPVPALFLPGDVATALSERDLALSPDGKLMLYTVQLKQHSFSVIVMRKKGKDNTWSRPEVVSFSGKYSDLEPAFTPDGSRLFFSSNRPLTGEQTKDYDIWYVERTRDGWSPPKHAGNVINTTFNEFYPSVATGGNLYFTSEYKNGVGREDIYVARWNGGAYEAPVALDTAVNSSVWEFNAFVSPDEQFILFTSYGREGDLGGGDLYISTKNAAGQWQPAKAISILNSQKLDYCPYVSPDKKTLYFASNRVPDVTSFNPPLTYERLLQAAGDPLNGLDNLYWVSFDKVIESLK